MDINWSTGQWVVAPRAGSFEFLSLSFLHLSSGSFQDAQNCQEQEGRGQLTGCRMEARGQSRVGLPQGPAA